MDIENTTPEAAPAPKVLQRGTGKLKSHVWQQEKRRPGETATGWTTLCGRYNFLHFETGSPNGEDNAPCERCELSVQKKLRREGKLTIKAKGRSDTLTHTK